MAGLRLGQSSRAYLAKAIKQAAALDVDQPHKVLGAGVRALSRKRDFKSPEIRRRFEEKTKRLQTAINLGVPDRVPVITCGVNFHTANYLPMTVGDFCFNPKKMAASIHAFLNCHPEFDSVYPIHFSHAVARIARLTQADLVEFPGPGASRNASYQFVEKKRIEDHEYADLIANPGEFAKNVLFPRVSALYRPGKGFPPAVMLRLAKMAVELGFLFKRIADGMEYEHGTPLQGSASFISPYDVLSLCRSLENISLDLFRRPEMVEQAADRLTGLLFLINDYAVALCGRPSANLMVERAFSLSPRHFRRFYLPSLKKVVEGLAARGLLCHLYLESDATQHLESLRELPPKSFVVHLDKSNIIAAKKALAGHACIAGNVPLALMVTGTPDQVKDHCQMLIQEVAPGGGFILCGALGIPDDARVGNVRAMVEHVLEHGKY